MTQQYFTGYPARRLRRMRRNDFSRRLMAEHKLTVDDLIYPFLLWKVRISVNLCRLCQE